MRAEWPLVGRAGELRRLQRIDRPHCGGVVIAGASGVGKTRLASEYLAVLERKLRAAADELKRPSGPERRQ